MQYSIDGKKLRLGGGVEVTFDWPIKEALEVGDLLVIRTESPPKHIDNCNVYGVSSDGNVAWRVQPIATVHEDSPFVSLSHQGENVALTNWDGMEVIVEARTGEEVSRRFRR